MEAASPFSDVFQGIFVVLLLVFGIIWLIFPFIVDNRLRGIRQEIEKANRSTVGLAQEIAKGNQLLSKIANANAEKASLPAPPGATTKLNISKDGQELGPMDISMVRTMLNGGQLTLQDHYFDTTTNEWTTLDCRPEFN